MRSNVQNPSMSPQSVSLVSNAPASYVAFTPPSGGQILGDGFDYSGPIVGTMTVHGMTIAGWGHSSDFDPAVTTLALENCVINDLTLTSWRALTNITFSNCTAKHSGMSAGVSVRDQRRRYSAHACLAGHCRGRQPDQRLCGLQLRRRTRMDYGRQLADVGGRGWTKYNEFGG